MAKNDIYNSKKQYETIVRKIRDGTYLKPDKKVKYFIRNHLNLRYFEKLIKEFEFKDISFIRRIQFFKALRKTCYLTEKDLKDISRDDVKDIVSQLNSIHRTPNTRRDFINYNKATWKVILPERDARGRVDESITPYVWRITANADKSLQKDKPDKLTKQEYVKILNSLSDDPRTQLYFSLMFECLARPQELCYIDIKDVDIRDNYARIRIKEYGKEGTKTLQVIDSYFYLTEWLGRHPLKLDQNAPLFLTLANNNKHARLTPKHVSKILRRKLKELGINKPITNYSFKRNGVTVRYLAGEPAQNIQKIAGWTSTDQLQTYDLSGQEDFLNEELIRKGIVKPDSKEKERFVAHKNCMFCNKINPISNEICSYCKRPLNREKIFDDERKKDEEILEIKRKLDNIHKSMDAFTRERVIANLKE